MSATAFYEPLGPGRLSSTSATTGPWSPDAQHAGPPSALLARAIEQCDPRPDQRLARLTVDILGPVPVAELAVSARVVRPGRRVTLVEAALHAGDRTVLSARGWRVARPGPPAPPDLGPALDPPDPDTLAPGLHWPGAELDGYLSAVEWRFASGAFAEPGPARVWARPRWPLVAGEPTSPFCGVVLVADSGSGVSSVLSPEEWLFMNIDLTVTLHRPPDGPWVFMDAVTTTDPGGVGMARTVLGDGRGPVGMALQTLVVFHRP